MGWGRTLFLGDIGNRLDIEDTERDIEDLKDKIFSMARADLSQGQKLETLVRENAELKLYLASVIRLFLAKGQITKPELEAMVSAIDREDGQADGQYDGKIH